MKHFGFDIQLKQFQHFAHKLPCFSTVSLQTGQEGGKIKYSNGKIADTICEATGAKKLEMNSCHNLSQKMFDKGETYISVMQKNLKNLKEALS